MQLGQVERELARRFAGLRSLAGFPALRDIAFGNALTCGIGDFAFPGAFEHALPAPQPALGCLAGNGGTSGVLRLLGIGLGDGPLHLLRLIGSGFLGFCDREALQAALQRGAFAFRRGGLIGRRSGFPRRRRRGVPVPARLHRGDVQRLARLRRLAGSAFRHGRPRRLRDRRPDRLRGGLRGGRPRRGPGSLRDGRPRRLRDRPSSRLCGLRGRSPRSPRGGLPSGSRSTRFPSLSWGGLVRRLVLLQACRALRHGDAPLGLARCRHLGAGLLRRTRGGVVRPRRSRLGTRLGTGDRLALNGRARRFARRALFVILLRWLSFRYHVQNTFSTCSFPSECRAGFTPGRR